jgi:type III pantothenate kinase
MQNQSLNNTDIDHFFATRSNDSVQTVDYGNSHPHFATFINGKLENVAPVRDTHQSFENAMISSVSKQIETPTTELWHGNTFCKMPVNYNTDELGKDRLFQAAFLYHLYPNEEIVLIDAGTFLTIDFINDQGFNGGFIFQGIKTFLSSYKAGTRLPDLSQNDLRIEVNPILPSSTEQAIMGATAHYIQGIIQSVQKQMINKKIILTGGESRYFENILSDFTTITHLIHYSLYFLKQEMQQRRIS